MPLLPNASMCFSLHSMLAPVCGIPLLGEGEVRRTHTCPGRPGPGCPAGSSPLDTARRQRRRLRGEGRQKPSLKRVRSFPEGAAFSRWSPALFHSTDTRKVTDKPTENTHARLSAARDQGRYGAHTTGHAGRR